MLKSLTCAVLLASLIVSPAFATNPTLEQLKDQYVEGKFVDDQEAQEALLQQILKLEPNETFAYEALGSLYQQQGRIDEAIALYQAAIQRNLKVETLYETLANLFVFNQQKSKAIDALQQGIRANPSAVNLYGQLAIFLRDENRIPEAIAVLRQGLKYEDRGTIFLYQSLAEILSASDPNAAIALLQEGLKRHRKDEISGSLIPMLGDLLDRQKRIPEAIALYREEIRRRPNEAAVYFGLANLLDKNNRTDEAIAVYQEAIKRNPKDSILYVFLGDLYQKQNQNDKAIALYQEGIRKAERLEALYAVWANLLERQKRRDEAIAVYQAAIKRNPTAQGLYTDLARLLEDSRRIDEAVALYRQSIEQKGLDRSIQLAELSDMLVRQKQVDRAVALYREYTQRHPDDVFLLQQFGDFLFAQSRGRKAEPVYRQAIQHRPQDVFVYSRLAAVLNQQNRGTEAIAVLNQAIQASRKNRMDLFLSYVELTWAQVQEKQFTEATRSIQQAIKLNNRLPVSHCLQGGLLALQNQPEAAIASYRKLLTVDDSIAHAYCTVLGVALLRPDQFESTIAQLRQKPFLEMQGLPIDAKALGHNAIGEVLQHQGKIQEAIAEYEKAIKIDAEFAIASQNLQRARSLMR